MQRDADAAGDSEAQAALDEGLRQGVDDALRGGLCARRVGLVQQHRQAAQAAAEQKQRIDQPLNNQPVWKEIRSGEPQITTVRGRETNVLIQSEGQTWRAIRVPIATAGGWLLALTALVIMGFYAWRGPIELDGRPTGRLIQRFTAVKRAAHWAMALSFVALVAARPLIRALGSQVEAVITRLLGVLLAALAAQFVIDGIQAQF